MVVMSKPLRLQGWGAAVTRIIVVQSPSENLQAWRTRVEGLLGSQPLYLLPDQINILGTAPFEEGAMAAALGGEGAAVTVLGLDFSAATFMGFPAPGNQNGYCGPELLQLDVAIEGPLLLLARSLATFGLSVGDRYCLQNENHVPVNQRTSAQGYTGEAWRPNARIDGLSIHGSSNAPGILVNGNARYLEIANDRIFNNVGSLAGGIMIGHPGAELPLADEDANNRRVSIHNNQVTENAGLADFVAGSGGGGIVIGTGAPDYLVQNNWIAGNFTGGQGAGISHTGLSPNGVIDRNTIVFNESFNQGTTVSGGGIFIGGRPATAGELTPGAGNVRVSNNLIHGNQAAAGDGGGLALVGVNGIDLTEPTIGDYAVAVYNNVITNNEAGLAGGGISLRDAVNVSIIHTTIVHNDSLATAGAAFAPGSPQQSTPQPAGIASRGNSPGLPAGFSNPVLLNSIVWQNRSFYYGLVSGGVQLPGAPNPTPPTFGLIPAASSPAACTIPTFVPPTGSTPPSLSSLPWRCWDLGVLGAAGALNPLSSVLTSTAGYHASNISAAPSFVGSYANGARNQRIVNDEQNEATILVPAAFDEGGNFIRPLFGPLAMARPNNAFWGNRHLTAAPPAAQNGRNLNTWFGGPLMVPAVLLSDFDAEARPPTAPHRGADHKLAAAAPTTPVPTRR
jgi:hypothetical protein